MVLSSINPPKVVSAKLVAATPVVLVLLYAIGLMLDSVHRAPSYALLVPTAGVLLGVAVLRRKWRDIQANQQWDEGDLLVQYAYHDALTKLPNRLLLRDRLALQLASIRRAHVSVAMLMIDLDGFKQINDTLGHLAGDELLVQVAERLRLTCRETDTVARLGGDEFAVLQAIEEKGQAAILANRIIDSLAQPFLLSKGSVRIGCSIGITITQDPEMRLEELIDEADFGLYRSKKLGGNTVTFFDRNFDVLADAEQTFATELRAAIEAGAIPVRYTRQFDRSGTWVGVEADLVWARPGRGELGLRMILAALEDRRLGKTLIDYLFQAVARDTATWSGLRVTINVTPLLLSDRQMIEQLRTAGFTRPERRCTYDLAFDSGDFEHIGSRGLGMLEQLGRHGYGLVIDCSDSSAFNLSGIARLRPGRIRINRQFVSAIHSSSQALAAVQEICAMGLAEAIELIADGVESEAQKRALRDAGCHYFQGPMCGLPVTADVLDHELNPVHSAA